MNAEELLIYIKDFVETLHIDGEVVILPTTGNPNEQQNDVTIMILEDVEGGAIPKYSINVKDLNP